VVRDSSRSLPRAKSKAASVQNDGKGRRSVSVILSASEESLSTNVVGRYETANREISMLWTAQIGAHALLPALE